jgi:hypothetical protein
MGLLKWLADRSSREVLRLHIHMSYALELGRGAACVRWTLLDESLKGKEDALRCSLVALLYARVLTIHHADRAQLFQCVDRAMTAFLAQSTTAPLVFEEWVLNIDPMGPPFVIWPWAPLESPEARGVKTHVATLRHGKPTRLSPAGLSIDLEMPLGMERVRVPASVMIAASDFFSGLEDPVHREVLARLLLHVNRYYGTAENAALMSEGVAVAAALQNLAAEGSPAERETRSE